MTSRSIIELHFKLRGFWRFQNGIPFVRSEEGDDPTPQLPDRFPLVFGQGTFATGAEATIFGHGAPNRWCGEGFCITVVRQPGIRTPKTNLLKVLPTCNINASRYGGIKKPPVKLVGGGFESYDANLDNILVFIKW